ncbi:MFS transporter [Luteococcus sp. H138]|uniref:MFS transporter n=1 Tax=unclassified Luteococcus TaxID=2639923 RepID=UPI00313D5771
MTDQRLGFRDLSRNQQSLFLAQLVESVGNFGLVTAFILWATTIGTTPARIAQLVSWVILANTVPRIVLAPLVAGVCNRVVEPTVLIVANLTRGLVCVLGLALGRHSGGVVATLAVATTLGALDLFFPPARAAAAQRNLHEHQRAYFGALNFLALSGVGLISSAITPAIFARGGLPAWLAIGLACSLVSAGIVRGGYRLEDDLTPRSPRHEVRPSIWQGLRFAFTGNTHVALVTWSVIGYGLALGLTNQTMTPLAIDGLRIPMAHYGWIPAAFAIGGLLAYRITHRATSRHPMTTVLLAGAAVLSLGYLGYGLAPNLGVCVAAMLLAGIGFGLWSSVQGAILQGTVPNTMMATYVAGTAPLTPLASLLGSQAGRWLVTASQTTGHTAVAGYRASYLAAAIAVLLGAALRLAGRRRAV